MASESAGNRRALRPLRIRPLALAVSSVLGTAAAADGPTEGPGILEEVVVTAQKRAEDLQLVPVSVQTLDTQSLEQLHVTGLDGYGKYLTSLTVASAGPSQAQLYIRGVTNGGDGAPFGPQPLVGVYLDELPVSAIGVALDLHIYDIERVEALSGPQGTLYGASSMAGTLRIITNKPSTAAFEAGYDVTGSVTRGDAGGKVEAFVNVPLSGQAAVRLVAYAEHDAGYIDNRLSTDLVYPTSGAPRTNTGLARPNFNPVDTSGGRAALKLDLGDQWTVTPAVIAQQQSARGVPYYYPPVGSLDVYQFLPDVNDDRWWQAALTVEGRISDLDVVYAGGLMRRTADNHADYTAYTYYYDSYFAATPSYFGDNFRDNAGNLIAPAMSLELSRRFEKQSHELRVLTPTSWRLHGVVGAFLQRQSDDFRAVYDVPGLADIYSITNQPGVWYLNSMIRTDRDKALFTDWSFEATSALTLTAGIRAFAYDNTVYGFFGWNGKPTYAGWTYGAGEQLCFPGTQTAGSQRPCVNVDYRAASRGETYRANASYRISPAAMVYATWSTGFRPGGVNRQHTRPAYAPDYLTNVEAGWKTEWLAHRLRFNGAVFLERWKDAQFSVLGPNQIEEFLNAGTAEIRGIEAEVTWVATPRLTLTGALTALNARLTTNACLYESPSLTCTEPNVVVNPDGSSQTYANSVIAPEGTRLPISARLKGNAIARYRFALRGLDAHVQGALIAQSDVRPVLSTSHAQQVGMVPGYASVDLACGVGSRHWDAELYVQNAFDRRADSARDALCVGGDCLQRLAQPIPPRLVGLTFSQRF